MEVPPSPWEVAAAQAFDTHCNSVVQIIGYTREQGKPTKKQFLGSGFIIGKKAKVTRSCLVLTCAHVLEYPYQSLRVRLSNTNEDLEATALFDDELYDLGVLVVQGNFNALHRTIGLAEGTADAIPVVGTLAALVAYYNAPGLNMVIRSNGPLFSRVPGAFGGYIMGPPINKNRSGITLRHGCYGIKGCSGGPLISHDNQLAIGVFQGSVNEVHEAISNQTVHQFLIMWLTENGIPAEDNDTMQELITKCQQLY